MNPVYTAEDVAEKLKCSPAFIRKLARRREIPAIRLGNRWRFTDEHLAALVAHLEQPAVVSEASLVGARSRRRAS